MEMRRSASSSAGARRDGDLAVVLRDDLVVVRELRLDELHRESGVADVRKQMAVVHADLHRRLRRLERATQLREALAWNDDGVGQRRRAGERALDLREAMAVGRDHARDRLVSGALGLEEDAVQVIARLVGGDGKEGLADHVAQRRRVDGGELHFLVVRQLREVAIGHADDLVVDAAGADLRVVVVGPLEGQLFAGQRLDDVVKVLRRDGEAAFALHLARQLRGDGHVEIGRRDEQAVFSVGAKQHVGQDGHRALAIGDALSQVQAREQRRLVDLQLHVLLRLHLSARLCAPPFCSLLEMKIKDPYPY